MTNRVLCPCCKDYNVSSWMELRTLSIALGVDLDDERDEDVYECDECGHIMSVNDPS